MFGILNSTNIITIYKISMLYLNGFIMLVLIYEKSNQLKSKWMIKGGYTSIHGMLYIKCRKQGNLEW